MTLIQIFKLAMFLKDVAESLLGYARKQAMEKGDEKMDAAIGLIETARTREEKQRAAKALKDSLKGP